MNKEQAMKKLHLRENDPIYRKGVLSIIAVVEKQLRVWSIPNYEREELEEELEALHVLLQYAQ